MTGKGTRRGLARLLDALHFSAAGFRAAWRNEEAFRQETLLCVLMIPAALWLGTSALERAVLIASCLIVLITELLNTAVEATVDRVGRERHELSGQAKDLGSAAVLLSLTLAVTVWSLVAWGRFTA